MTTRLNLILKENEELEQKNFLEEKLERERRAEVELKYSNLLKNVANILGLKRDKKSYLKQSRHVDFVYDNLKHTLVVYVEDFNITAKLYCYDGLTYDAPTTKEYQVCVLEWLLEDAEAIKDV